MSSLLRSLLLLLLFFGGMFLVADSLCAQGPPPLPRPNTNNTQLKGLGDLVSGAGNVGQKTGVTGTPQPVQASQAAHQDIQTPEPISPPKLINQASFTTFPLTRPADESVHEELPPESLYEHDNEPLDAPNAMLDKQLLSKKSAKEQGEVTEGTESKIGGWRNKLAKPDITPIMSVGGSLFIVIAAFFLLAILLRKVSPKGNRPLPKEAFECLGRYFLTQKHQLQLLRLGNRIVLVSVMPDGVSTLAEITDPDEAVALLGLCRRLDTHSATEMFRKTIANMSEDELSRPHKRPVVTTRRKGQPAASLDLYSDPDESLAAILARGRHHGR